MQKQPQILYHYTSLETLALILENKTICFNSLLNVDDIDEAETSDLGTFGKYVYVSCWTDEAEESIAMWQMYTPNMHGIRIQLPVFPFKKHFYNAGEFLFQSDTSSYIDIKKVYEDNRATIVTGLPKLVPVTYTKDEALLKPRVRFSDTINDCENVVNSKNNGNQSRNVRYDLNNIGKFKKDVWWFQKEWRYRLLFYPASTTKMIADHLSKQNTEMQNLIRRLVAGSAALPFNYYDLHIRQECFDDMSITLAPDATDSTKMFAELLVEKYNPACQIEESVLTNLIQ